MGDPAVSTVLPKTATEVMSRKELMLNMEDVGFQRIRLRSRAGD